MYKVAILFTLFLAPPGSSGELSPTSSTVQPVTRKFARIERQSERLANRIESLDKDQQYLWASEIHKVHPKLAVGLLHQENIATLGAHPHRTLKIRRLERAGERLGTSLDSLTNVEKAQWAFDMYREHPWLANGTLNQLVHDQKLAAPYRASLAISYGDSLLKEWQHEIAISQYEAALEFDSSVETQKHVNNARRLIAERYIQVNKYEPAIAQYKKLIDEDGTTPLTRLKLAQAQSGLGKAEDAFRTLVAGYNNTSDDSARKKYINSLKSLEIHKSFTIANPQGYGTNTGGTELTPQLLSTAPGVIKGRYSSQTCIEISSLDTRKLHDALEATIKAHQGYVKDTTELRKEWSEYSQCRVRVMQSLRWFNGGSTDPEGAGDSSAWEEMDVIAWVEVRQKIVKVTVEIVEDRFIIGKKPSSRLKFLNVLTGKKSSVPNLDEEHPLAKSFGEGLRGRLQ